MDNRIRPLLTRYADFDFKIDYDEWEVSFSGYYDGEGDAQDRNIEDIKVSRGEENIFIWCFFLAIVQLAIDGAEAYKWVKYVYIDDPISSLDEHNAITVANHLAQLLITVKRMHAEDGHFPTHHTLFFNVMGNELKKREPKKIRSFLNAQDSESYLLRDTGNTPFFQHVATWPSCSRLKRNGKLYTHHFNMLRSIIEKTASFHGYAEFW